MPKLIPRPEDKYKNHVINNIEYLCKEKNVTLEKARVVVGCSKPTFNCKRKNPGKFTLDELMRLAKLLHVQVSELLTNVR